MNAQDFSIQPANARQVWLLPAFAMVAAVVGISPIPPAAETAPAS